MALIQPFFMSVKAIKIGCLVAPGGAHKGTVSQDFVHRFFPNCLFFRIVTFFCSSVDAGVLAASAGCPKKEDGCDASVQRKSSQ